MGWEGELVPSDQSISLARQNVKYALQNVGDAGLRFAGNRGMIALKKEGGASYRRHSVRVEGAEAFLISTKVSGG
jgi:hypothetical protein